jgi:hypothetical protein
MFVSDIEGQGSGPVADARAGRLYNEAAEQATHPEGANWKAAQTWLRTATCENERCLVSGRMVIGPYVTIPNYDVRTNPTRVRLTGQAGCTAILYCKHD